jgi:hypothetical protein
MASPAFERFRFSFFDDESSARDGVDTAALARLQGGERAQAEAIKRAGGKRDVLAAIKGRPVADS